MMERYGLLYPKMETAGFSEMLINFCQVNAGRHIPEESIIQVMYLPNW
jgi:hypothetical protein